LLFILPKSQSFMINHVLNIFTYLKHSVVTRLKAMLLRPTQARHSWPGGTGAWRG
jgi:hypothetical protein